jgi:hypothetical protein
VAIDFSNWLFVLSQDGTLVSKHVRDALLIFVLIETVRLFGGNKRCVLKVKKFYILCKEASGREMPFKDCIL